MFANEEFGIGFIRKRTPVPTDAPIVCDDWLKDTRIIVRIVLDGRIKNNVTTFITNQILIVWRNQKVFPFTKTSYPAILMKVEGLPLV